MSTPSFQMDWDRRQRTGLEEAVLCASKSAAQIAPILQAALEAKRPLLLTRLAAAQVQSLPDALRSRIDFDELSQTGVFQQTAGLRTRETPLIAVVAGGTSDLPVVREIERTLAYHGEPCSSFVDVGVSGLWRLLARVDALRQHAVIIVVAGMEGALPSVVSGLVPSVLIAVPTSVGYGVAAGGQAALNTALASCGQGLTVMNIDNGFGAACAALRAVSMIEQFGPASRKPSP